MGSHSNSMGELMRLIIVSVVVWMLGVFFGIDYARNGMTLTLSSSKTPIIPTSLNCSSTPEPKVPQQLPQQAQVPHNLTGPELLPPGIVAKDSDLFFRRLWGRPEQDLPFKPKYLVAFTVGFELREMVNATISKFSKNFTIILFHYDGRVNEWEQFEWSREVIHISARKQSKWWYAKRFLHPDIVAPYEYIFIWDEDLDAEHFEAEAYIELAKKHSLEISQPGVNQDKQFSWRITKQQENVEVHKIIRDTSGPCKDSVKPPCAGFVEIMAPVFSRKAWQCVWYMIQNDLIHGWGLDLSMGRCVEPAYENMGVVDAQWIYHRHVPSLRSQGEANKEGKPNWQGVNQRCFLEKDLFLNRLKKADNDMLQSIAPKKSK